MYAVGVAAVATLLAPWMYVSLQGLARRSSMAAWLARQPLHRVFDRTLLAVAVIGLWPLCRCAGIRTWAELGWRRHPCALGAVAVGVSVAALSVAATVAAVALAGKLDRQALHQFAEIPVRVLRYAVVAAVVAVIEETFFRGALQGVLQRAVAWPLALVLASTIYAALHFLKAAPLDRAAATVSWYSGLSYWPGVLSQTVQQPQAAVKFVTLWLVGATLGWAFRATGSLHLSIGLHAGWVWLNEFCRWWGFGALVYEPWAWASVFAAWMAVGWLCRCRREWVGG